MVSCCAGAELQVRSVQPDAEILMRELYPMKSDLYERARDLHSKYLGKTDGSSRSHEEHKGHEALKGTDLRVLRNLRSS
jgi:hypothetical protein